MRMDEFGFASDFFEKGDEKTDYSIKRILSFELLSHKLEQIGAEVQTLCLLDQYMTQDKIDKGLLTKETIDQIMSNIHYYMSLLRFLVVEAVSLEEKAGIEKK
jgi:hypothetical protein